MMVQVKLWMQVIIDPDEYPIPSDGDVTEELYDALKEYFHDISGANIKILKIKQEETEQNG